MSQEASKTRSQWSEQVRALLTGEGIDIGCGPDPITPTVDRFDVDQGDANHITRYVTRQYDFVFSSHTLEHMTDAIEALRDWYRLVRPGGHLIVVVPDEDLYEQGRFPSVLNRDHKATFTIAKARSWSPRSVNVLDLIRAVGGELINVELQDKGYDRRLVNHAPGPVAVLMYRISKRLLRIVPAGRVEAGLARLLSACGVLVDQTALRDGRLAQIQFIVRKPSHAGA